LILLCPCFIEKTLRLKEVDDLPRLTQTKRDGCWFDPAPKAVIFLLDPMPFSILKEMETGLCGFWVQGEVARGR
jgi:hypothetical protein